MNLKDKIPDLKLKAKRAVDDAGLGNRKAQVAGVLDISGSTEHLYRGGVMDAVTKRALALGLQFDDNGRLDMFTFGEEAHDLGQISEANIEGFVAKNIRMSALEPATIYSSIMWMVAAHFFPDNVKQAGGGWLCRNKKWTVTPLARPIIEPVYVQFVTDGNCNPEDVAASTEAIQSLSAIPIFWQFIGLGSADFKFLKKLDTLSGRVVDNAGFFAVNDISEIDDAELYRRMLAEFPSWLDKVKQMRMIA